MSQELKIYLEKAKERDRKFIEALLENGAEITVLSEEHRLLSVIFQGKELLLLREHSYFNKKPSTLFAKHKHLTKIILEQKGIPVPKGFTVHSMNDIESKLEEYSLRFPVVLKPVDAAKGIGVSVGIPDKNILREKAESLFSYLKNASFSNECVIEEMVPGSDYRVLVFFGKVIGCVERMPAFVIGTGNKTIEELITLHNADRPKAFVLVIDEDLEKNLEEQNLSLASVPEEGVSVVLRKNANISSGGVAKDHTNHISEKKKEAAIEAAKILGLNFCGIDMLTEDISSDEAPFHIIEINGAPDYDIHEAPIVKEGALPITDILAKKTLEELL